MRRNEKIVKSRKWKKKEEIQKKIPGRSSDVSLPGLGTPTLHAPRPPGHSRLLPYGKTALSFPPYGTYPDAVSPRVAEKSKATAAVWRSRQCERGGNASSFQSSEHGATQR